MPRIREVSRRNVILEVQSARDTFVITSACVGDNWVLTAAKKLCASGEAIGTAALKFSLKAVSRVECTLPIGAIKNVNLRSRFYINPAWFAGMGLDKYVLTPF